MRDLLLALEVESPGNPLYDHHVKRELYLSNGVPENWIASAEARIVTRWPTGRLEHDQFRGLPQPLYECPHPTLIIGHRPVLATRPRRHHQFRFRDINPDQHPRSR